jgi:hypothetical protein
MHYLFKMIFINLLKLTTLLLLLFYSKQNLTLFPSYSISLLLLQYHQKSHYPPCFPFSCKFSFSKDKEHDSLLNHNNKQNTNTKSKIKDPLEIEQLADILDDFKMVNS